MTLESILLATAAKLDTADSAPADSEIRCTRVTAALAIAKLRRWSAEREATIEIRASRCNALAWYASQDVYSDESQPATLRSAKGGV
jgi:hypothetical protein